MCVCGGGGKTLSSKTELALLMEDAAIVQSGREQRAQWRPASMTEGTGL